MSEKTGQQSIRVIASYDGRLPKDGSPGTWYEKVRVMRKHPTISMARKLVIAPALAAQWSVEQEDDAPEGAKELIEEMMLPARLRLMQTAMLGVIDFGWQPFEKVFNKNSQGQVLVTKFKPLLQDITEIYVKEKTGAFDGFRNGGILGASVSGVDLNLTKSLLFSINVEGTDWYGHADLEACETAYDEWKVVNSAAARYDKKIAGSMWVVHYPLGYSMYQGVETSNDIIADAILTALESSGALKVPRFVEQLSADLDANAPDAWKIELMSDKGVSKAAFLDRQNYLDKLMIRGLGMPERSVLEGQFGTKAEAEAHGDFAITNIELRHSFLVQEINWHAVNQVLRLNYGPDAENLVYIKPTPLTDPVRGFLRDVYKTVLMSPDGYFDIVNKLDLDAMADQLSIPMLSEPEEPITEEE